MNKPVYLGLSLLEVGRILMYEFSYNYAKPKNREKSILCCMDTDSFVIYTKAKYIYVDIAKDIETRFDTSIQELERPLPKAKSKKVIELMKDKLDGKVMSNFIALRPKTYRYLTDDKAQKFVIK